MCEIWKDISGYEGLYQVSNLGHVRSVDRDIVYSTGRIQHMHGMQLKCTLQSNGYYTVGLYGRDHKVKTISVHRLVAIHFILNPDNYPEVNHKDGDKANNCVTNLEWVSELLNIQHAYASGLKHGKDSPQCIPVKNLITGEVFYSIEECARCLRVSSDTVSRKLHGHNVPCLSGIDLQYLN